jgi:hypothetical protein
MGLSVAVAAHPPVHDRYAAFTNQGFLLREVIIAAGRRTAGEGANDLLRAIRADDLFQLRAIQSRETIGAAVVNRLAGVDGSLLTLLAEGSADVQRCANFYLILLQHRLLRELIAEVLIDARKRLATSVTSADVSAFFTQKRTTEPAVAGWSEATLQKARSNMLRICVAAGVLGALKHGAFALHPQWVPTPLRDELTNAGREAFLPLLLDAGGM